MSSKSVRDAIFSAVEAAAAPYPVYDLSDYVSLEDALPSDAERVVLIQYVSADSEMQNIAGEGNQGWREDGSIVIHIMTPAGFASSSIVEFGDSIVDRIKGARVAADVTVESMSPFSDFGNSATSLNGGSWKGWAANMFYVKRECT